MKRDPTIWDWPLRLWHWAFAAFIAFSLYSGLKGDISLMEWHLRSGLVLLGCWCSAWAGPVGRPVRAFRTLLDDARGVRGPLPAPGRA